MAGKSDSVAIPMVWITREVQQKNTCAHVYPSRDRIGEKYVSVATTSFSRFLRNIKVRLRRCRRIGCLMTARASCVVFFIVCRITSAER